VLVCSLLSSAWWKLLWQNLDHQFHNPFCQTSADQYAFVFQSQLDGFQPDML
jgi:hypothetical protein